ncbi:hypothetical protein BDN72DRAFT_123208 [Pluteus cervinus]|uniref:Uncharacterized protein n=1 Tax=Pluteus cervinus TaxID=181527 RepID=A0ACD3B8V9_9AGAR|nr:hypothetical protein BDN72DRAFT_123208 [Pluteus cervinus]
MNARESQPSGQRNMMRGPGLPSGPRLNPLPAMRKPPSLSTLAVPSVTGMRPASETLINALTNLITQLPRENQDLLKTVTDLIKATAKESKATKMPLSNLLLVFCPSLNMNPPLLRALCESESIWGGIEDVPLVVDIRRQTVVPETVTPPSNGQVPPPPPITRASSSQDGEEEYSDASESLDQGPQEYEDGSSQSDSIVSEDPMNTARLRPRVMARKPVPTHEDEDGEDDSSVAEEGGYNRNTIHARTPSEAASYDTPSLQDDVSYVSTSEGNSSTRPNASSPSLSLSSAESLATPHTTSADASLAHLPLEPDSESKYFSIQPTSDPAIHQLDVSSGPPSLMIKKKNGKTPFISNPIAISSPVHFPGSASSSSSSSPEDAHAPTYANVATSLESKRRSVPTLSLPNIGLLSDSSGSPDSPSPSISRRIKRPSLHLFSKRSSSSLSPSSPRLSISSPFMPYMQSPRSASDSSVSTPISAVTAPQMLSSTSTFPPKLETPIGTNPRLSLDFGVAREEEEKEEKREMLPTIQEPISVKPGETPIANLYRSGSSLALRGPSPQPTSSTSSATAASHLRPQPGRMKLGGLGLLGDEPAEDWTQSVLSAADFSWSTSMNATTSTTTVNTTTGDKESSNSSSF